MTELQKLKQLLDDLMIANEMICNRTLALVTKPVFINDCQDGLYIYGWGFSGLWPYSAEFVAKMLDRKFREEAVNNQYLLRMQKESAADESEEEPERKTWTVCDKRLFPKRKRRRKNNSAR